MRARMDQCWCNKRDDNRLTSNLNQAEEKPGSRGLMQKKVVGNRFSGHGGAVC